MVSRVRIWQDPNIMRTVGYDPDALRPTVKGPGGRYRVVSHYPDPDRTCVLCGMDSRAETYGDGSGWSSLPVGSGYAHPWCWMDTLNIPE